MSIWVTVLTLVTVNVNKSNDPDQEFNRALMSRKLQDTMGNISTKYLLYMINKRLIQNCPITIDDLKAANDILVQSSRP